MNYIKNIKNIKNFATLGLSTSFISGFTLGLIPNKISIKINKNKYNDIPTPIVGGVIGMGCFIFSPFLMINYFSNSYYLDKFIDKYDLKIKRYHQYDGLNNKYAYPSIIQIEINTITDNNNL